MFDDNEFDGLSLADLFAESDVIGDKYLSDEEIEDRNMARFEAAEMLDEIIESQGL
jgi:hypothetical protein